ncbi:nudix hydrolase 13, mitochondrial-like [Zingiber officinale]|uniref:nudix hydrolase 13, mitochondrial-like n=1 Tax=Zingiber officinale TaxID=94328 RepID=UPI001C4D5F88|nr:nudix hydrolase 13, mitochondrial-like [Zingiber officinale]XP_042382886.1 nudix hydrolase 13, mitochondrial-like [Zingiber officinale]
MSSLLLARKGRHQQRYHNQLRLVAGCIPYKISRVGNSQSGDVLDRVEVLMISSPDRHDFVFPKGGWEIDETASEAACREALEEAGVRGTLNETALGVWEFRSKSRQNTCSLEGTCKGYMFALEVTEELNCYPEMDMRARKWVTVREAYELCRYNWMREALDSFRNLMTGKPISSVPELSESSAFRIGEVTAANYAIVPI